MSYVVCRIRIRIRIRIRFRIVFIFAIVVLYRIRVDQMGSRETCRRRKILQLPLSFTVIPYHVFGLARDPYIMTILRSNRGRWERARAWVSVGVVERGEGVGVGKSDVVEVGMDMNSAVERGRGRAYVVKE